MRPQYLERLQASELTTRPPWLFVTSREAARALGVHTQTLTNWRHRDRGPRSAPDEWFRGRSARYQIAELIAWAHLEAGESLEYTDVLGTWFREFGFDRWREPEAVAAKAEVLARLSRRFSPEGLTATGRRSYRPGQVTVTRSALGSSHATAVSSSPAPLRAARV